MLNSKLFQPKIDNIFKIVSWLPDTEDPFTKILIGDMGIVPFSGGYTLYQDPGKTKDFYINCLEKFFVSGLKIYFSKGGKYFPKTELQETSLSEGVYKEGIIGILSFNMVDENYHFKSSGLDFVCDFTNYPSLGDEIKVKFTLPKKIFIPDIFILIGIDKIKHLSSSIQDLVSILLREQNIEPTEEMVDEIVKTFHFENEGPLEKSIREV